MPIPAAPIDPLVSMTSIVLRGCCAGGCDGRRFGPVPPTVALTEVGSTASASSPRMTSVAVTASSVTRRSLNDAGTSPRRHADGASDGQEAETAAVTAATDTACSACRATLIAHR